MSLVDELVALGHLGGPETMAMLTSRWRSATRQFYVLEPSGGWTDESREDLLHEFLSEKLEDLTDAVVAVRDDDVAVVKVASRIMKNWLIDQARKTDAGAIRVRLEELLGEHEMFIRPAGQGHRWALVGAETDSGVDIDSLVAAAVAVREVRAVRWSDDTRRAPMASGTDLVRVLEAVLQRAGGSVEIGTLVAVFRRRFAVTMASLVPLEADDTLPDRLAAPIERRAADAAEASNRAAQVYAQLSGRERLAEEDDERSLEELENQRQASRTGGRVRGPLREQTASIAKPSGPTSFDPSSFVKSAASACSVRAATASPTTRVSPSATLAKRRLSDTQATAASGSAKTIYWRA